MFGRQDQFPAKIGCKKGVLVFSGVHAFARLRSIFSVFAKAHSYVGPQGEPLEAMRLGGIQGSTYRFEAFWRFVENRPG